MRRTIRGLALRSLAASLPVAGLLLAMPAGGASAAVRPSPSVRAAAMARTAIEHLVAGQHLSGQRASSYPTSRDSGPANSTAGYYDTGTNFSRVAATWAQPSITCTSQASIAVFFIAVGTPTFAGGGTLQECYQGEPYQYTFWQIGGALQQAGSSVASGDAISADLARSGDSYRIKITDSTHTANSLDVTQTCSSCQRTIAFWETETVTGYPLADFGGWNLSNAQVTQNGDAGVITSFPDTLQAMVDSSGKVEAQPGALNDGGDAFTVAWKSGT